VLTVYGSNIQTMERTIRWSVLSLRAVEIAAGRQGGITLSPSKPNRSRWQALTWWASGGVQNPV
jgi:hypothetical protein